MARSVNTIHQSIMDSIAADTTLNAALYSTSRVAIYRLFAWVVSVAIWMHETLFEEHKAEVNAILATNQTHNRQWYANKAKAFQFGDSLVADQDYYAVIDETKKIVAHAAVDEVNGTLIMKVAKEVSGSLAALSTSSPDEKTPFEEYMFKVKDAGVKIIVVSTDGDNLKLVMDIWYDPLVLNSTGKLLSNSSSEPAKETIKEFIKSLPFNGEFVPTKLVDALQGTVGVKIPVILTCQSRYGTNEFSNVDGKVIPYSGYLTIANADLTLNYRPDVRS